MTEWCTGPSVRIIDFIDPDYRGKPCPFTPVFRLGAHNSPNEMEDAFVCPDCGKSGPEKGDWRWDIGDGKFCHQCGYIYIHMDKAEW